MGNNNSLSKNRLGMKNKFISVSEFEFMEPFEDKSTNGLYLNHIFVPEEVIVQIISHIPPKDLLKLTLVCKKWCNIVKSQNIWMKIYNRRYASHAAPLPWYVFYCYFTTNNFDNLLKNGNGQDHFRHWEISKNVGNGFVIEDPPCGADPLPLDVPDFNGYTSCFATSFGNCNKVQEISLRDKRLLRYILNKFKPHIYVSEWVTARFDCGYIYKLVIKGYNENFKDEDKKQCNYKEESSNCLFFKMNSTTVEQWEGKKWEKTELLIKDYSSDVAVLMFEHKGCDNRVWKLWKGYYGCKMAGGVVRFLFDSIHPVDEPKRRMGQYKQHLSR